MTPPYFHDGSVADLKEAVRIMAKLQLNKDLDDAAIKNLVAFLESLTEGNSGTLPAAASASQSIWPLTIFRRILFMKHVLLLLGLCFLSFTIAETQAQPTEKKMINPKVKLETTMGDIVLELDAQHAPMTTENFLAYVKEGFYDGTIFHRVIPGFMIQGGGLTPDLAEKPAKAPIQNEANNGLLNQRGTIAMARTSDPHSATAQFFINVNDNDFLNFKSKTSQGWGYAVFGKVIEGMDVVDKIVAVETGSVKFYQDVPKEPIIIKKAVIIE